MEEEQNLRILDLGAELSELCSQVLYELDLKKSHKRKRALANSNSESTSTPLVSISEPPIL